MKPRLSRVLVDSREFIQGKKSGIARVLEGLVDALAESDYVDKVLLAGFIPGAIPNKLREKERIYLLGLPSSFLSAEKALAGLSEEAEIFISPYPKLPLFGCHCKTAHIIHDVLDLTHPLYRKRLKANFDSWRLKSALKRANLTWYDSAWSMEETKKYAGHAGHNPKVRYPGIDGQFSPAREDRDQMTLKKYGLEPGYVLCVGNGLPHKNLGVLLDVAAEIPRKIVTVGARAENQLYWKARFPQARSIWIEHAADSDLPVLMRGAFCLAQPSTAEGYGYPPLEAMGCGVPAVTSNIPVLVETTGGNALTADHHDSRAWVQALKALEDRHIHQGLVEKGLRWVMPLQDANAWRGHISDIEELLRRG
jgi:glycosyltransferase involved in cell wall biosynthesis